MKSERGRMPGAEFLRKCNFENLRECEERVVYVLVSGWVWVIEILVVWVWVRERE